VTPFPALGYLLAMPAAPAIDTDLLRGPRVAIGRFRCPLSYPSFRDTGPIPEYVVVFPRTGVWIQHEGAPRFLADPTVVTMYNPTQRYERFAASPDGDRSDWLAVSDPIAREIVRAFDQDASDTARPFRFASGPSSAPLYVKQRALHQRARLGRVDALEAEETVIAIVAGALALAYASTPRARARRRASLARHRELADAARVYLHETLAQSRSVHDIATALGASPYHLCRVFRASTGRTLHEYRTELRVRVGLEALETATARGATLSGVAHELGFASHAHFSDVMRKRAGLAPSALRALLCTA
jgi:AraC family transcriptional regulator